MNPATAAGSLQGPNPLFAILCAGLACGVLDITAALVVYGHYGRPPMRLLQGIAAGLRPKDKAADVLISAHLRRLLKLWQPTVLVFGEGAGQIHTSRQQRRLLKRIATEAKDHHVVVRIFRKRLGIDQGKRLTKYENARPIAEQSSVLQWKIPPKRTPWESEDYRMSIFTAATLGMVQFNITNSFRAPSSPQASR
jgi:hypothetical protein